MRRLAKAREDAAAIEMGSDDDGPGTDAAKVEPRKRKNQATKGHRERSTRQFISKYDDIVP